MASTANQPAFWPEALEIIASQPIALLATTRGQQPHVRPVTPAYVGLEAYVLTAAESPKTRQILQNGFVELLHWTVDFRHLNLAGRAEVIRDSQAIEAVAPHFPYEVGDFFGPDIRPAALIKVVLETISITTFDDIIASKQPRVWRNESTARLGIGS